MKGQYSTSGGGNYGGYDDVVTNDLFNRIDHAGSMAERKELLMELSLHIAERCPVICLYPRPELTAVNKRLHGFVPHFRQFENVVNANLRITP
jgi:peptide/nickel transport system substrate-binding protein